MPLDGAILEVIYAQTPAFNFNQSIETDLEIYINEQRIGDFKVEFLGNELTALKDRRLKKILRRLLKEDVYQKIEPLSFPYLIEEFPFPIVYDDKQLRIIIKLQYDELQPDFYNIDLDPSIKYEGQALNPADLSGSLGWNAEKSFSDQYFGGDYFTTSYNTFINFKGYLLESQGFYQEGRGLGEEGWFRGNTRLTKDFEDDRIRFQLGDTSTRNLGFMTARNIGGLSLSREFSINPYERPFPQGEREFTLLSRSRVRTFVNGTLIKDEFLPAGNYKLSRLPLIDGINFVKLEIENAFGEKSIQTFDIPTSTQILKEGVFDFHFSAGRSYNDNNLERSYNGNNLVSLYGQYGFSSTYTGASYSMFEEDLSLGGLINGISTTWGNFFYEVAYSNQDRYGSGIGNTLTWQLQNSNYQGVYRVSSSVRIEDYMNSFTRQYSTDLNPLDYSYQVNLSSPLSTFMSVSGGASVAYYQDRSLGKRTSYNISSNIRMMNSLSMSIFGSRVKEANQPTNVALSMFLTWNFDTSQHYANYFHDFENKRSRLSVTRDNNNQMYRPRYNVNLENGDQDRRLETRVNIPTPMADIAIKGIAVKDDAYDEKTGIQKQGVISLGSALLFAANFKEDRTEFSYAISRSNSGSFAVFNASDDIEDDQILIRSTSPYADTETPLIGSLSLPNLVDYQYREVQIDPTLLDDGVSLKKESYVLHSGFKTGHLITIESDGHFGIEGKILYQGKPLAHRLIKIGTAISFTDLKGSFYISGVNLDDRLLEVDGVGSRELNIRKSENYKGIINLGVVKLDEGDTND